MKEEGEEDKKREKKKKRKKNYKKKKEGEEEEEGEEGKEKEGEEGKEKEGEEEEEGDRRVKGRERGRGSRSNSLLLTPASNHPNQSVSHPVKLSILGLTCVWCCDKEIF